jgi:hypothetical protein
LWIFWTDTDIVKIVFLIEIETLEVRTSLLGIGEDEW